MLKSLHCRLQIGRLKINEAYLNKAGRNRRETAGLQQSQQAGKAGERPCSCGWRTLGFVYRSHGGSAAGIWSSRVRVLKLTRVRAAEWVRVLVLVSGSESLLSQGFQP